MVLCECLEAIINSTKMENIYIQVPNDSLFKAQIDGVNHDFQKWSWSELQNFEGMRAHIFEEKCSTGFARFGSGHDAKEVPSLLKKKTWVLQYLLHLCTKLGLCSLHPQWCISLEQLSGADGIYSWSLLIIQSSVQREPVHSSLPRFLPLSSDSFLSCIIQLMSCSNLITQIS